MKQIFFDGKGQLHLQDVPSPALLPGHILVQNSASLISTGTEAMALSGGGSLLGTALKRPDLVQRALKLVSMQGITKAVNIIKDAAQNLYHEYANPASLHHCDFHQENNYPSSKSE